MDLSIIVRFRNEARFLDPVLNALVQQDFTGTYEVVAVDNNSSDESAEIARRYTPLILTVDDYRPGMAINQAIQFCSGDHIAILSAHTIPSNRQWLNALFKHMQAPHLAGVYGAQLYPLNSRFLDKRDLDIFSTLTPRVETHDSDFWNANAMFPRAVWEKQPFDERVYELEDHHWTKVLLPRGYCIHFEPEALVYHYAHTVRLDREHLSTTGQSADERIASAIAELADPTADWPRVMCAGLTLSSLTRHPGILDAVPLLCRHLLGHADFDVRWRMAQALGKIPDRMAAQALAEALNDTSYYPRDEAAWSLARLGAIAVPAVMARLPQIASHCRPFAALALGLSGVPEAQREAVRLLGEDLNSEQWEQQRDAAWFAGELADLPEAATLLPRLQELVSSPNDMLSFVCCWAIGCFASKPALNLNLLVRFAKSHPHLLTRFEAIIALGKLYRACGAPIALEVLCEQLVAEAARLRYAAIQSLRLLLEAGHGFELPASQNPSEPDFGVCYEWSRALRAGAN